MTFKQKLNISYTLIIIILIIVVTYSHYLIHLSNTKRNMSTTMDQLSNELSSNLDSYLSGLISSTMQPLYDRDQIEQRIAGKHFKDLNPSEIYNMENYIRSTFLYPNTDDITAVHLYDNQMDSISLFQKGQRYSISPDFKNEFSKAKQAKGRYVVSDTFMVVSSSHADGLPLFSILKLLNIFELNQPYALLVLDVNLTRIDSLLSNIQIGSGSYISIVNEQDKIIYSTNKKEITFSAPIHNANNWLQAESELKNVPWKIKLEVPLNSVLNQRELLLNSLLIMTLSILAAIIFSGWFSRKITLPLVQLQRLMRRAEDGDFNLRFQTKSRDEIFQLGNSFNQMLSQIENLINRTYIAEIRQRDAQFSAFQSQINPHFLFNTLETIRMMAEAEGNKETVKLISSLGKLLKVNFQQRSWITLQEELDYVQHYLDLQSVRLSYSPKVIVYCEESLKDISIHALTIQPLVENSILHGLRPLPRSGKIHVSVKKNETDATFEIHVTDDGVGMSEERLEELKYMMQLSLSHSSQGESIGILNVQRRIQLSYGENYGLTISSKQGHGTSVTCILPLCNNPNTISGGIADQ